MIEHLRPFILLLLILVTMLASGCTKKFCREAKYMGGAFVAGAAASAAYVGNFMGIRKRKHKKPVVEAKSSTANREGSVK